MSRRKLPAPVQLAHDLERTRALALEVAFLAQRVAEPYAEGYDASLSSVSGGSLAPARTSWVKTDPTGDIATSGLHSAMRERAKSAAHSCKVARDQLEVAKGHLLELFLNSDPQDPHRTPVRRENHAAAS